MTTEDSGPYSEAETSALQGFLKQRLVMYKYTQPAAVANFATIAFGIPEEFGRLHP